MNTDDKLEGMLLKCSCAGIDGGRVGLASGGALVMTLGERSLANQPLLAEEDDDDDDEDEAEVLTRGSLVTHELVPPEQLMMQEEVTKSDAAAGGGEGGGEVGVHFPLKLTNKLPSALHMPVSSHWWSMF